MKLKVGSHFVLDNSLYSLQHPYREGIIIEVDARLDHQIGYLIFYDDGITAFIPGELDFDRVEILAL